jgi:hypothetical protein
MPQGHKSAHYSFKALTEVRRLAPREGRRYHHVKAIIVAIDQYAEAALGNLSLSETLSGWRLTENRAMLLFNEGSFQAHWLGGCRSIAVAGSARGRDLDIAAANKRSTADCS